MIESSRNILQTLPASRVPVSSWEVLPKANLPRRLKGASGLFYAYPFNSSLICSATDRFGG